jgi:tetratricopeptide (TPR) repeat protein
VSRDELRPWKLAGAAALLVIVLSIPVYLAREQQRADPDGANYPAEARFVGRDQCADCHEAAYDAWTGSHHDLAMAEAADDTVVGDFDDAVFEHAGVTSRFYRRDGGFFVHTEGSGGEMGEFEVRYTFGIEPLQQYLVPFPGGRLQVLPTAWDTEQKRWFFMYAGEDIAADDWMHWTRNAQNWNGMCAECHSTHLQKNYDPESRTFNTTWSEIDVSCEACHGPASGHVEWAEIDPMGRPELENYGLVVSSSGIDHRQQVEMCAPCHSRRAETGDYDHLQVDLMENQLPSLLLEGLYHPDGQILEEVYVWGSFVQSKMYQNGVRCSDCHDVHSLELHREGNELCLQCHRADTYDVYEHHFHKKIHEGEPSDGALCIRCHMPEQTYMGVDERADHSLRIPRPDLSLEIGVPNSCSQSGCHDDKDLQWSADAYTEWYGQARKPHFGTIFHAARNGDPAALDGLLQVAESTLYPALVRATALSLLQSYSDPKAITLMQRALVDEEAILRHTAVMSMPMENPRAFIEQLAPLLFDSVRTVRMAASSRLAGIDRNLFKPYQLEQLDLALAEYVESMRANLDFAASGMNLAMLLSQQGENQETERLLREVLKDYPEQHDAAYSLALLLVGLNRADEGLEYLGRASKGLPRRSRVHYNYGLLLAQMGEESQAEGALQKALALEPANMDYLYALVDFYYKRGRMKEALDLAERMIIAQPENPLGHNIKAAIEGQ